MYALAHGGKTILQALERVVHWMTRKCPRIRGIHGSF